MYNWLVSLYVVIFLFTHVNSTYKWASKQFCFCTAILAIVSIYWFIQYYCDNVSLVVCFAFEAMFIGRFCFHAYSHIPIPVSVSIMSDIQCAKHCGALRLRGTSSDELMYAGDSARLLFGSILVSAMIVARWLVFEIFVFIKNMFATNRKVSKSTGEFWCIHSHFIQSRVNVFPLLWMRAFRIIRECDRIEIWKCIVTTWEIIEQNREERWCWINRKEESTICLSTIFGEYL